MRSILRLLKLPAGVQKRVAAGVLSAGRAKALTGVVSAREGCYSRKVGRVSATGCLRTRGVSDYPEVAQGVSEALKTRVENAKLKKTEPGAISI